MEIGSSRTVNFAEICKSRTSKMGTPGHEPGVPKIRRHFFRPFAGPWLAYEPLVTVRVMPSSVPVASMNSPAWA